MKNTNRTLLIAASTAAALWVAGLTATAEEPKNNNQPNPPPIQSAPAMPLSSCTAYLKPDYVAAIKPVDFLDGNKLVGTSCSFEADFVIFSRKESKELIYIPKSAILYMTGKQRFFNF